MISHEHQFIFVHISHCGGTSVENALADFGHMRPGDIDPVQEKDILFGTLPLNTTQHMTALELKQFYGQEIWDQYYTFAFVSNPFDRMITSYLQRGMPIYGHKSLAEFLDGPYCNPSQSLPFLKRRKLGKYARSERMASSCYSWLCDEDGELLDLDFLGRKESLAEDFQTVVRAIGIEAELGVGNKTANKKPYQHYYDESTIKWVEERMGDDLRAFGYKY